MKTVFFKASETEVENSFHNNGKSLDSLTNCLRAIGNDKNARITGILVISAASPEGRALINDDLSRKRGEWIADFINKTLPGTDSLTTIISIGDDWTGTARKVVNSNINDREDVLYILKNIPVNVVRNNQVVDTRKRRLMNLEGGNTWKEMTGTLFGDLRKAAVVISYEGQAPEEYDTVKKITGLTEIKDTLTLETIKPLKENPELISREAYGRNRKTIFALKTNLLYDAITAVNFEIEIPMGDRFSLGIEDIFPWWSWGPNKNKYSFQLWTMGLEPRWWMIKNGQRDRLTGTFAGIYGMGGKYDFQFNDDGCDQGELWSAGLTYGVAFKLSRLFNIEFSISAGYLKSKYRHYTPSDDYTHLYRDKYNDGRISYFGPTKAKIALVLPITGKSQRKR
ncbi:MAG: DUF3575 domain-containing protein [Bacteroidales bacterium]|nr:DUF3575 domain-containing protein [Bacteroidales bacterium]